MTEIIDKTDAASARERTAPANIPPTPMFDRDAWRFVGPLGVLAAGLLIAFAVVGGMGLLTAGALIGLLALGVLLFFRDPERDVPASPDVMVSPADGRVVTVTATPSGNHRIDIFLSVFNVHINRLPIAGEVESTERRAGGYTVAYADAASSNAHVRTVMRTEIGAVEVRQIVGVLARRIVCRLRVGDRLPMGARIGLMRFGSRAEIEWPVSSGFEPTVKVGDHVRGGTTVVARRQASAGGMS